MPAVYIHNNAICTCITLTSLRELFVACMHALNHEVKHGLSLALLQSYLYDLLSYMLTCNV